MKRFGVTLAAMVALTACQSVGAAPARLNLADPATREKVTSALSKAVARPAIELGPSDDETTVVTVLPQRPGPRETHALAMPTVFNIVIRNGRCYAVRRDTGKAYAMPGATCRPAN